jgi:hypothetical protein
MFVDSLLKTKCALLELRNLLDGPWDNVREDGSSVRPESVFGSLRLACSAPVAGLLLSVSTDGGIVTGGEGEGELLRVRRWVAE